MSTPVERLRSRILESGPIPFAEFMAEALYGEGGYYRRHELAIGVDGDFVTGSSHSALFGRATARLLRRLDSALGRPADLLEVGYGSGRHLGNVVAALGGVEDRVVLALDTVERELPDGVRSLRRLEDLPKEGLQGLVFSYELFDALPVHRLVGTPEDGVGELWVDLESDGRFTYLPGELSRPELLQCLGPGEIGLSPGQIADVTTEWATLYSALAVALGRGILVTCDYGFERQKLFDLRVRRNGTLACYRGQRVHRDALRDPGQQDLTAHVDFTTLAQTGTATGLETVAFTRQARWLMACGLFDELRDADPQTRLEASDLLSPAGMGEEIRVLVQARALAGDALFDPMVLGGSAAATEDPGSS